MKQNLVLIYCHIFLQKISLILFVWLWTFFVIFTEKEQQLEQLKKKHQKKSIKRLCLGFVLTTFESNFASQGCVSFTVISSTPWEIVKSESDPWQAKMLWYCQSNEKSWKFKHDNVRYLLCLCFNYLLYKDIL